MKILIATLIVVLVAAVFAPRRYQALRKQNLGLPPQVVAKVKADKKARTKIRNENPILFKSVSECLFKHDPVRIGFESNTDEYEPEAGTIIPRLSECLSEEDVVTVVHEEFRKWFDAGIAGSRPKYVGVAHDIWTIWNEKKLQMTNLSSPEPTDLTPSR